MFAPWILQTFTFLLRSSGSNTPPELEEEESHSRDEKLHISGQQDQTGSQDGREPTFSSDGGGPTPYAQKIHQSPGALSSAFSSHAQSIAFTPTPAFPLPRARFNIPTPNELLVTPAQPQAQDDQDDHEEGHAKEREEEPLTPHTSPLIPPICHQLYYSSSPQIPHTSSAPQSELRHPRCHP